MSWQQLLDIIEEAKDMKRQEAQTPPTACPIDGEPLSTGPSGQLFCKFCGLRVNR